MLVGPKFIMQSWCGSYIYIKIYILVFWYPSKCEQELQGRSIAIWKHIHSGPSDFENTQKRCGGRFRINQNVWIGSLERKGALRGKIVPSLSLSSRLTSSPRPRPAGRRLERRLSPATEAALSSSAARPGRRFGGSTAFLFSDLWFVGS